MSDELAIMNELGDDTELLLAPDEWLENQRVSLQQKLSIIAEQLDGVLSAQRIKRQLQQRNMVAVRCIDKIDDQPCDVIIRICPIGEAIVRLDDECADTSIPADVSEQNAQQQHRTWLADGYDIAGAKRIEQLKRKRGHG